MIVNVLKLKQINY